LRRSIRRQQIRQRQLSKQLAQRSHSSKFEKKRPGPRVGPGLFYPQLADKVPSMGV
jgi:hypothetical protein